MVKTSGFLYGSSLSAIALGLSLGFSFLTASGCALNLADTSLKAASPLADIENLPPSAVLRQADILFEKGDYAASAEAFGAFEKQHARNGMAPYALYRQGQSYAKIARGPHYGQEPNEKAIAAFDRLLMLHPGSPYEAEVKALTRACYNQIAEASFIIGEFNYNKGNHYAAARRFETAASYKNTDIRPEALHTLVRIYNEMGLPEFARDKLAQLAADYPGSKYAPPIPPAAKALAVSPALP